MEQISRPLKEEWCPFTTRNSSLKEKFLRETIDKKKKQIEQNVASVFLPLTCKDSTTTPLLNHLKVCHTDNKNVAQGLF